MWGQTEGRLDELDRSLHRVEAELNELAPAADSTKRRLEEILSLRDQVRRGLALLEQKQPLEAPR
jgi:hypothetical protein